MLKQPFTGLSAAGHPPGPPPLVQGPGGAAAPHSTNETLWTARPQARSERLVPWARPDQTLKKFEEPKLSSDQQRESPCCPSAGVCLWWLPYGPKQAHTQAHRVQRETYRCFDAYLNASQTVARMGDLACALVVCWCKVFAGEAMKGSPIQQAARERLYRHARCDALLQYCTAVRILLCTCNFFNFYP